MALTEHDDLREHKALVTGATSGIGRAIAMQFARMGAEVLVHGRDATRGSQVVEEIERAAGWAAFECGGRKDAQPVINVLHLREALLLVIYLDLTVLEPNVAGIEAVLIMVNGHQPSLAAAQKAISHGPEIDGQIRITIENKEMFA